MKLQGGEAIAGRPLETSKFWVKVEDASGNIVYVNKAFITTIHPRREELTLIKGA